MDKGSLSECVTFEQRINFDLEIHWFLCVDFLSLLDVFVNSNSFGVCVCVCVCVYLRIFYIQKSCRNEYMQKYKNIKARYQRAHVYGYTYMRFKNKKPNVWC